jgi:hypothetical protein
VLVISLRLRAACANSDPVPVQHRRVRVRRLRVATLDGRALSGDLLRPSVQGTRLLLSALSEEYARPHISSLIIVCMIAPSTGP